MSTVTLEVPRSASADVSVTITEDDEVTPINLTGGVLRFWVAYDLSHGIDQACFVRRSYNADEVLFTDAANGEATVFIISENTEDLGIDTLEWIIELTRRGASKTTAGTIDVEAGSGVLTGVGLETDSINNGDLLVPAGTGAANQKTIIVRKELDANGAPTGNLVTDYTDWATETGITIEVFKANKKFPTGLCGPFDVTKC